MIRRIKVITFSPTGTTKRICDDMADTLGKLLSLPVERISYTLPKERASIFAGACEEGVAEIDGPKEADGLSRVFFGPEDLVIWGSPVYAGRIPNKTLADVKRIAALNRPNKTQATLVLPVVVYGNRSFDNALSELTQILSDAGFLPVAAAAVVARHTFSETLGKGRPDAQDFDRIHAFCRDVADRLAPFVGQNAPLTVGALTVPGEPYPEKYYTPLKEDGSPAVFLKAVPAVRMEACTGCGSCASVCPMGSIRMEDAIPQMCGICIKCQACIRSCPQGARYFEDAAFLSHVAMIEEHFGERKEPMFF